MQEHGFDPDGLFFQRPAKLVETFGNIATGELGDFARDDDQIQRLTRHSVVLPQLSKSCKYRKNCGAGPTRHIGNGDLVSRQQAREGVGDMGYVTLWIEHGKLDTGR